MSVSIHPTSFVDPKAQLGENVSIGPFSLIGPDVKLGDNVTLVSHVNLTGDTTIGKDGYLYPYVSMGFPPQDFKHQGGPVSIEIGERCTFRESCTVHPGTDVGVPVTRIGDDCFMMVGVHVAHEVQIGNHVICSNYTQLAGNTKIGHHVILGGLSAVHQHTRIGDHAFVGAMAMVTCDVIPYGFVVGNAAHLAGLNVVGLRRRGFSRQAVHELRSAYRLLFAQEGTFAERLEDASRIYSEHEQVKDIVTFIRQQKDRALCMPHTGR